MLVVVGTRTSLVGVPGATVRKVALALLSPAAVIVTVAFPTVVGVKLEVATPPIGVTGDVGLKAPDTPLTEKVIGLLAVLTGLPPAS